MPALNRRCRTWRDLTTFVRDGGPKMLKVRSMKTLEEIIVYDIIKDNSQEK